MKLIAQAQYPFFPKLQINNRNWATYIYIYKVFNRLASSSLLQFLYIFRSREIDPFGKYFLLYLFGGTKVQLGISIR